jgi:hypothetical protein
LCDTLVCIIIILWLFCFFWRNFILIDFRGNLIVLSLSIALIKGFCIFYRLRYFGLTLRYFLREFTALFWILSTWEILSLALVNFLITRLLKILRWHVTALYSILGGKVILFLLALFWILVGRLLLSRVFTVLWGN